MVNLKSPHAALFNNTWVCLEVFPCLPHPILWNAQLETALRACDNPKDYPIYNDGVPIGYFKQAASKLELVNRATDHNLAGRLG